MPRTNRMVDSERCTTFGKLDLNWFFMVLTALFSCDKLILCLVKLITKILQITLLWLALSELGIYSRGKECEKFRCSS